MKPVLCLGDVCMDLIVPYAEALRAKVGGSSDPHAAHVLRTPGGSVANTATSIAKLNVPVWFTGTCGNDAFGYELKCSFADAGVDTHLLRTDDVHPTQLVLLILDENGDRTAFACPAHGGSQHAILPEQIPEGITDEIGWLHVSGMMLRENPAASVQLSVMQACHAASIPVSLDINARVEAIGNPFFYRNLVKAAKFADVILGSAVDEIPLLAGQRDAESAAFALCEDGTTVIARNGDQGAVLYQNQCRVHFPAFSVNVKDAVGAGDTFDGAFIAARMKGQPVEEAIRVANAAAAVCVSRPGGRSGPTESELCAFLKENPHP